MNTSPVLVLVHDEEGVNLPDLVAQHVHDLFDELGIVRILEDELYEMNFFEIEINIITGCDNITKTS